MKNIKQLSDSQLLDQIRANAANERRSGLAVIHQLREVSRRRLDSQLGYSSLHKYCMEELKYSSGSAWRRIKAMEALQDLPEIESRIAEGELTLANVSQVQSFCAQSEKSLTEKKAIFDQVAGLSKRETERVLVTIAPLPERPEKIRPQNQDKTELRITLDAETLAQLEKVRDLIAHAHPGASYADVISYLAKLGLKKLDPAAEKRPRGKVLPPGENVQVAARTHPQAGTLPHFQAISRPVRRTVWQRDLGRCGYASPETGKTCGATAFLQLDHIVPRAKCGGNEPSNLRLRCQRHNLLAAIEEFGPEKMEPHLKQGRGTLTASYVAAIDRSNSRRP